MKCCEEYAALLDAFADGELPENEAQRVREHLRTCDSCAVYVADVMALRAAFPQIEETEPPEGMADAVCAAIRANAAPRRKSRRMLYAAAAMAACAAMVLAVGRFAPFYGEVAGGWDNAAASVTAGGVEESAEADGSVRMFASLTDPEAGRERLASDAAPESGAEDGGAPSKCLAAAGENAYAADEAHAYRKEAAFRSEEVGAALDGYSGATRYDSSTGERYTAYELSQREFDDLLAALDAADRATVDEAAQEDLCLVSVYP